VVAAALLEIPECEWHVVGDGPNLNSLKQRVSKLELQDRVFFHGELDRLDTYNILSTCDVAVYVSSTEGFCNSAAEALAIGLPLVVSDIPALVELTAASPAAVVKEGSVDGLVKALEAFQGSLETARRDAMIFAEMARRSLDIQRARSEHAKLYTMLRAS